MDFDNNIKVVTTAKGRKTTVSIEEYEQIERASSTQALFFMRETNRKLRRIRVDLEDGGAFRAEDGAFHYSIGDVRMDTEMRGLFDVVCKAFSGWATSEPMLKPLHSGTGVVYLEPRYSWFVILAIEIEKPVIIDQSLYYASEDTIVVERKRQTTLSSAVAGGEGLWQTRLSGQGWAVLEFNVPPREIQRIILDNSAVRIDGTFSVLRKGQIEFTVERSARSIAGSVMSSEGFLQVFRGTGEVWVCPTERSSLPPI